MSNRTSYRLLQYYELCCKHLLSKIFKGKVVRNVFKMDIFSCQKLAKNDSILQYHYAQFMLEMSAVSRCSVCGQLKQSNYLNLEMLVGKHLYIFYCIVMLSM